MGQQSFHVNNATFSLIGRVQVTAGWEGSATDCAGRSNRARRGQPGHPHRVGSQVWQKKMLH